MGCILVIVKSEEQIDEEVRQEEAVLFLQMFDSELIAKSEQNFHYC